MYTFESSSIRHNYETYDYTQHPNIGIVMMVVIRSTHATDTDGNALEKAKAV